MSDHPNQAETVARRAVELSLKIHGEGHPITATAMLVEAKALRRLRNKKRARDLEKRAKGWLRSNANRNLAGYTVDVSTLAGAGIR